MQNRTTLVAIDMNIHHPGYDDFAPLSAKKKIDSLVEKIEKACLELKEKEPDRMWLFSCREYAITSPDSKFIDLQDKNYLKEKMMALTEKFPQLTVCTGAVAVKKHFDRYSYKEKLSDILVEYEKLSDIEKIEKKSHVKSEHQVALHLQKIQSAQKSTFSSGIDVVRNSCYLFQGGKFYRHDKMTPYLETKDGYELPDLVFEPGNSKTQIPYFIIQHPLTKQLITIGVEICREHDFKILQKALPDKIADIHLLLSYGIQLNLENTHGHYVLQLDSQNKPHLILSQDEKKSSPVNLYQLNFLDTPSKLVGPLQPIYPFEKRISKLFRNALEKISKGSEIFLFVTEAFKKFQFSTQSIAASSMYETLEIFISQIPDFSPGQSFFKNVAGHDKQILINLKEDLTKELSVEIEKNPVLKDINAKTL